MKDKQIENLYKIKDLCYKKLCNSYINLYNEERIFNLILEVLNDYESDNDIPAR